MEQVYIGQLGPKFVVYESDKVTVDYELTPPLPTLNKVYPVEYISQKYVNQNGETRETIGGEKYQGEIFWDTQLLTQAQMDAITSVVLLQKSGRRVELYPNSDNTDFNHDVILEVSKQEYKNDIYKLGVVLELKWETGNVTQSRLTQTVEV